jgi:hypothetical protein
MDPSPMNPKGFCESEGIAAFNDELLETLGSSWFDWKPLKTDLPADVAQRLASGALGLLSEVFPDTDLYALKDPRICRLVEFWDECLRFAGRDPKYVLIHRDPREVSQSLDHCAGYDPAYGELLWLRYVLDSEIATRGRRRLFVSYMRLLGDSPNEADRISKAFSVSWQQSTPQSGAFVEPGLRRSRADGISTPVSAWAQEVLAILERWSSDAEEVADHPSLDAIRVSLDSASASFHAVVENGRLADIRARRLEERIGRFRRENADLSAKCNEAATALETSRRTLEGLAEDALRAHGAREAGAAEIERLHERVVRLEDERDVLRRRSETELEAAVRRSLRGLDQLERQSVDREARLTAIVQERNLFKERANSLMEECAALRASTSWRVTAPLRAASAVLRQTRLSQRRGKLASINRVMPWRDEQQRSTDTP